MIEIVTNSIIIASQIDSFSNFNLKRTICVYVVAVSRKPLTFALLYILGNSLAADRPVWKMGKNYDSARLPFIGHYYLQPFQGPRVGRPPLEFLRLPLTRYKYQ